MSDLEISPRIWLSEHASIQLPDRKLRPEWVVYVLSNPEFVRSDWRHPGVKLAFARVPEFGNRWMRVAFAEREKGRIIITAMFDRKAEKWR